MSNSMPCKNTDENIDMLIEIWQTYNIQDGDLNLQSSRCEYNVLTNWAIFKLIIYMLTWVVQRVLLSNHIIYSKL